MNKIINKIKENVTNYEELMNFLKNKVNIFLDQSNY